MQLYLTLGQIDRKKDRQIDRQKDRKIERQWIEVTDAALSIPGFDRYLNRKKDRGQIERQIDGQIVRQIDRYIDSG